MTRVRAVVKTFDPLMNNWQDKALMEFADARPAIGDHIRPGGERGGLFNPGGERLKQYKVLRVIYEGGDIVTLHCEEAEPLGDPKRSDEAANEMLKASRCRKDRCGVAHACQFPRDCMRRPSQETSRQL